MISVCMATYNGGKYIESQLQSILDQLSPNDEVVISDDGSTDDTLSKVKSFADDRISIVDGPKLHSPSRNFENAIRHSKGNIIFLSDQDDVWCPNKVQVMSSFLQKVDCVVSDCMVTDSNLNVKYESFRQLIGAKEGRFYNLFVKNSYSGSCMAFRRKVLERAIPCPKGILMHDIWYGNVAAFKYSLAIIPDKLIYFRRHEDSSSSAASKSTNPVWKRFLSRFLVAWHLLFV